MAKAYFNDGAAKLGLVISAESAGTLPGERVHPEVVEAMREVGLDVSSQMPRLLTDDMLADRPLVFTMGCAVDSEACPSLQLDDVVDWGLPDPKGRPMAEVRKIRDEIALRVAQLLAELAG
jgi:arsenate reductase